MSATLDAHAANITQDVRGARELAIAALVDASSRTYRLLLNVAVNLNAGVLGYIVKPTSTQKLNAKIVALVSA